MKLFRLRRKNLHKRRGQIRRRERFLRARMDYTKGDFWIAILAGGSVIAAASAGQQIMWKDPDSMQEGFRARAVVRDFCIGAFLTAVLYMFLPESFQNMISVGSSAAQSMKSAVVSSTGGGASSNSFSGFDSMEIRTGPARF
jgi:hypothetical protein